jgi:hypothetical protein
MDADRPEPVDQGKVSQLGLGYWLLMELLENNEGGFISVGLRGEFEIRSKRKQMQST